MTHDVDNVDDGESPESATPFALIVQGAKKPVACGCQSSICRREAARKAWSARATRPFSAQATEKKLNRSTGRTASSLPRCDFFLRCPDLLYLHEKLLAF